MHPRSEQGPAVDTAIKPPGTDEASGTVEEISHLGEIEPSPHRRSDSAHQARHVRLRAVPALPGPPSARLVRGSALPANQHQDHV